MNIYRVTELFYDVFLCNCFVCCELYILISFQYVFLSLYVVGHIWLGFVILGVILPDSAKHFEHLNSSKVPTFAQTKTLVQKGRVAQKPLEGDKART